MDLETLREKHPRFVYDSYDLSQGENSVKIIFNFVLEPNVVFQPKLTIPKRTEVQQQILENFAFHLGMIEAISYWKAACPKELLVKAGNLSAQQVSWWHDLFIHGLGELFYKNGIDFSASDFLQIIPDSQGARDLGKHTKRASGRDLVLIGGGKDSTVTLELLGTTEGRKAGLALNPTRATKETAKNAGFDDLITIDRSIDRKLLELNKAGYINGHTPFSAYLAFLGVFAGVLNDFENVISSNERGAGEGNILFHGIDVNHQYSKSYRFEKLFREYCSQYLSDEIQYFSFLRPLYDLQVSELFSIYPKQREAFKSCNIKKYDDSWCNECAKCSFVYLSMFPFLGRDETIRIFGEDLFQKQETIQMIRELVGLGKYKPFDCVGTTEESTLAVALSIQKYRQSGEEIPKLLAQLEKELKIDDEKTVKTLEDRIRKGWGLDNFLPEEYVLILKNALIKVQP
ncbi:MAG: hypothetical protein A2W22_05965 [Candidatus Levybacteria bacterium RBG_16_35_11]|nr:MAG: hypothetical protein A2W22_05965 [Candidatus Levybacteria bacterium RBG_16_35_11]